MLAKVDFVSHLQQSENDALLFLHIEMYFLQIIQFYELVRLTLSGPGGLRGPDGQTHSCQSETSYPMMPKLGDF